MIANKGADKILESTFFVASRSKDVQINKRALERLAKYLSRYPPTNWLDQAPRNLDILSLDEKLHFLLVFNSISFCYWGNPKWAVEYQGKSAERGSWSLYLSLFRAIDEGKPILDAKYLSDMSYGEFNHITRGNIQIPFANARRKYLNQIGAVLNSDYGGSFRNFLTKGDKNVPSLIERITSEFPCFMDESSYEGQKVYFYKRAQVLIGDLYHFLKEEDGFSIQQPERLTACADYKLPQVLRHHDVLRYSPSLASSIDKGIEIARGSEQEVEIRANTIWAVELLTRRMKKHNPEVIARNVNDRLWLLASKNMKPYHHTRTTAY